MRRVACSFKMFLSPVFLFLAVPSLVHTTMSRVHLTQDGGYKGIVVRIGTDVREERCQEVLERIKVGLGSILLRYEA